ncbi:CPBP family glutamic-type intramembrane protease [Bacillus suaedaesalsae]|uniref:CPBP family intramembrane metalloprotease n=1 Tax=Bacillus suaedaesalsae TaxID=2810349 RepID=A0ABS2DN67_9BACI|nr:CPBP family intramembrane metalloprotease [Bacillus suaedaesalsae]
MQSQADMVKQLSERELLFHLYVTQLILIITSAVLSLFLFQDVNAFQAIWELNIRDILFYGGLTGSLVVIIDFILMKVLPEHFFDDGGINEKVFQHRSIIHIFFLSWIIAISEEWLFRGVIQTHFGLVFASLVFAMLHVRYLRRWFLFTIVMTLSFILGLLYEYTESLWVTIFAHFLIDFIFGVKIRLDYVRKQKG